jgi:hypothetical protein
MPLIPFVLAPILFFFLGLDWTVLIMEVLCTSFWNISSLYWENNLLPIGCTFTFSALFMWLLNLINLINFYGWFFGLLSTAILGLGLAVLIFNFTTNQIYIRLLNLSPVDAVAAFLNSLILYFVLTVLSFFF